MRAVYLNNEREAELLEADGGPGPDDVVVAIGAGARYFAEKKRWNPRPIGSFILEAANTEARAASEAAIEEAIGHLDEVGRRSPARPLPLGEYFRFDLHMILGQIHFTRFVLESIAASGVTGHKVYRNKRIVGSRVWGIRPHPDGLIAEIALALFGGAVEVLGYAEESSHARSLRQRLRSRLSARMVDRIFTLEWAMRNKAGRRGSKSRRLLVLGGQFDWKPVLASEEFRDRYRPSFLSATDYPDSPPDLATLGAVQTILNTAVSGSTSGPVWDVTAFAGRIASISAFLPTRYDDTRRSLAAIKGVLAAVFVTPMQAFVADVATELGIPVICYQHGEQATYPEIWEGKLEATFSTYYFAYGEGVVPKYRQLVGKTRLRDAIAVGSTSKKVERTEQSLILYATAKWFKTARPFLHFPDPDDRLYETHRAIFGFLENHAQANPAAKIVVKGNNTEHFNELPYETTLTIDNASRFTSLLGRAKVVILDAPGTTAIEASSTSVPLFILSGRTPWYDAPLALMRKRAIIEDDPRILMQKLKNFLETGRYDADPNNREFAEAYGGAGNRETSINNVNHQLSRIIA